MPHFDSKSHDRRRLGLLGRWFVVNGTVAGLLALAWLVLRSGSRPSRLAYPCQRAALTTATLALAAPLIGAVDALRRALLGRYRSAAAVAAAVAGISAALAGWGWWQDLAAADRALIPPPADYRATVFHVSDCPEDPAGDHFPGLDALLAHMGGQGLKLYRSSATSMLSGPDGLIAADDVVVVKINYQWPERGGTNTDLLRGLIRRLVDHPDGFSGEVVVAENAQFASTSGFDRDANNAQDTTLSPADVVAGFVSAGHAVSLFDWTTVRATGVAEYSAGDLDDGYVVGPWQSELNGCRSHPKFRTARGTYVSLREGVFDSATGVADRDRLKIINLPVLKSHAAVYGATACTKNYMGVVTGALATNSHAAIASGLLGAVMADIRPPDLNILDAIWVLADPWAGPSATYAQSTRIDALLASTDPIAADRWAVAAILEPAFAAGDHEPSWSSEDPASAFRTYLDRSMSELNSAGIDATNDLDRIRVVSRSGAAEVLFADGFETADTAAWSPR